MENLTKQQLILLSLLVSFVTSIATGIVTVSLMNQAPVGVVQTINRVVEKTIQTVTGPAKETQTIVKETVVVNTDDQIVSAVEKNKNSMIRIYRINTDPSAGSNSMLFVGLGVVVSSDGVVATDNNLISDGAKYFTTNSSSTLIDLSILRAVSGERIALLKIKNSSTNSIAFTAVNLSSNDLKLGQSVIYIGGETKDSVFTGIVSTLSAKESQSDNIVASTSSSTIVAAPIDSIETSISANFVSGGLLLNLSGELVGIKSIYMDSSKSDLFTPSQEIQNALNALTNSQKKAQ